MDTVTSTVSKNTQNNFVRKLMGAPRFPRYSDCLRDSSPSIRAKRPRDAIRPTASVANRESPAQALRNRAETPTGSLSAPPKSFAPKHSADPDRRDSLPSRLARARHWQNPATLAPAKETNTSRQKDAGPPAPAIAPWPRAPPPSCSVVAQTIPPAVRSPRLAPQAIERDRPTPPPARAMAQFHPRRSPATKRAIASLAPRQSRYGREKHIPRATAAKEPTPAPLAFEATRLPSSRDRARAKALLAIRHSPHARRKLRIAERRASMPTTTRCACSIVRRGEQYPEQARRGPLCPPVDRKARARASRLRLHPQRQERGVPPSTIRCRRSANAASLWLLWRRRRRK